MTDFAKASDAVDPARGNLAMEELETPQPGGRRTAPLMASR